MQAVAKAQATKELYNAAFLKTINMLYEIDRSQKSAASMVLSMFASQESARIQNNYDVLNKLATTLHELQIIRIQIEVQQRKREKEIESRELQEINPTGKSKLNASVNLGTRISHYLTT